MYFMPEVEKIQRPVSTEEAVAVGKRWSDGNVDVLDQPSNDFGFSIVKNGLQFGPKSEEEHWPVTRSAMSTLLKQVRLPIGLGRMFDPAKEDVEGQGSQQVQASVTPEAEMIADRTVEYLNGILEDIRTRFTLRLRNGYLRCVLGPADARLDYDDILTAVDTSMQELNWRTESPKMFKEFSMSDEIMCVALTEGATIKGITEEKLFGGFKIVASETAEYKPDLTALVWRKICSNGLMGWGPGLSGHLKLRSLRSNPIMSIMDGIRQVYGRIEEFAQRSFGLRQFRLKKFPPGEERFAYLDDVLGRLNRQPNSIRITRGEQQIILPAWASQEGENRNNLYGLQNLLTALARDRMGVERTSFERAAGRLVGMSEGRLNRVLQG